MAVQSPAWSRIGSFCWITSLWYRWLFASAAFLTSKNSFADADGSVGISEEFLADAVSMRV